MTLKCMRRTNYLKMFYFSLAQSIIKYVIAMWGGTYYINIVNLEVTLRTLIKIILNLPRCYPTKNVYNDFNFFNLKELYYNNFILYMLKV